MVGAGLGGLCCAAVLAKYGVQVLLSNCPAHPGLAGIGPAQLLQFCRSYVQNYICRSLWLRATPFLAEPRMPGCKMASTLKAAHPFIAAWLPGRTHTTLALPCLELLFFTLYACHSCSNHMANTFCLHNRGPGANPIAHVLQAINEPLDLIEYNRWNVILPEGQFLTEVRLNAAPAVRAHAQQP